MVNEPTLKVYPNPTSNVINIKLIRNDITNAEVKLYNVKGQLVLQKELNETQVNTLELGNMTEGFYILVIKNDEYNLGAHKIIIRR